MTTVLDSVHGYCSFTVFLLLIDFGHLLTWYVRDLKKQHANETEGVLSFLHSFLFPFFALKIKSSGINTKSLIIQMADLNVDI